MTLLALLSWFLLGLSLILSGVVLLSVLLLEKKSEFSKWTSWIAFALGCLAVLTVVITTGYLGMRIRLRSMDEEPCADFGLKNNAQENSTAKWASWAAIGLCGLAVLAFVVLVALLLRDDNKKFLGEISHHDISNAKKEGYKRFDDYDNKEVKIISGKYEKLTSGPFKPKETHKLMNYASLGLLSAALICVLLLNYYVGTEDVEAQPPCVPIDSQLQDSIKPKPQNNTVAPPRRPFLVPREEWMAVPPRSIKTLTHPVEHVVVSYTPGVPCSSRSDCIETVRSLQISDKDGDGWWDITQNFLIAGDARVYEGRGWDVQGLPNDRYENGSLLMSFVGRFMHEVPPPYQMRALKKLVEEGIRLGKISSLYKLVIDHKANGSLLEEELQNWDHWFRYR